MKKFKESNKEEMKGLLENSFKNLGNYDEYSFRTINGWEKVVGKLLTVEAPSTSVEGVFQIVKTKNNTYTNYWTKGNWHDQEVEYYTEEQIIDFFYKNKDDIKIIEIY